MQFAVNNRQAGMDEEDSLRAERLLRFSLSRFDGTVSRVEVTFTDVNGPKGGIDRRCRIAVSMNTAGRIMAQSEGHDYTEALSLCLDRIVRAIRREVDMRRTRPIRKNRMNAKLHVDYADRSLPGSEAAVQQEKK